MFDIIPTIPWPSSDVDIRIQRSRARTSKVSKTVQDQFVFIFIRKSIIFSDPEIDQYILSPLIMEMGAQGFRTVNCMVSMRIIYFEILGGEMD